MAGITALRKIRLGKQTVIGTTVAPSTTWRGMGLAKDLREVKIVDEQIGIAIPSNRTYIPKLEGEVTFDPIEATYQQLPYILEAGIKLVTPAADGVGSGKIYAYDMPTTAQNTTRYFTITANEGGGVENGLGCYGCFVKSFKLSGNAGEGVMMEAVWGVKEMASDYAIGSSTIPALVAANHMTFGGSHFYIDLVSGTIGTTEILSTLLSFELDVTTGLRGKWTNLDKGLDFVYFDRSEFSATLKLVYEQNVLARTEYVKFEEATPLQVRLEFFGKGLTTPGAYDYETLVIDAAVTYTEMPFGDVDGNATIEATLQIGYDTIAALGLEIVVVNELAALP